MLSANTARKQYRRFFARVFVTMTLSAVCLFGLEAAFPPEPLAPLPPTVASSASDFDLQDLQLLLAVTALVGALASLTGLVITLLMDYFAIRRERIGTAVDIVLKRQDNINRLAAVRAARWRDGDTTAANDEMQALPFRHREPT